MACCSVTDASLATVLFRRGKKKKTKYEVNASASLGLSGVVGLRRADHFTKYGAAHQSHRVSRAVRPERVLNMLIAAFHAAPHPIKQTARPVLATGQEDAGAVHATLLYGSCSLFFYSPALCGLFSSKQNKE